MQTKLLRRKTRFWVGFTAGLAAGAVATAVMLFLNRVFGGISLPEVVGSAITALMSPTVFQTLHQAIGGDAKYYLFYCILAGQCLVFALAGALVNLRFSPQGQRLRWYHGAALAFVLWLLTGLILLPITGAGIFGAALNLGVIATIESLAIVGGVFGILFVFTQEWLTAQYQVSGEQSEGSRASGRAEQAMARRTFLKRGVVLAGIGVVGVGLWHFITAGVTTSYVPASRFLQNFKSKIVPPPIPNYGDIRPAPFLSPEVTSNDQYYVVSKNLGGDPVVGAGLWHLTINGQVENQLILSYDEIMAMPMQKQYESMMCISNEVGGPYMSNALWEGVRLVDLLNKAGVKPGATKVVFYAADDYSDSIHLSKALEPTTLLAVRMNGALLPQEHGFPARMLVPGIYGMKHCKWITRIEVVNYDFQGYWQQRGWSDAAPIRLTSRIDTPLDGSKVAANTITYIAGVAFSGNRGISEVDVSTDGGQTWQIATLKRPPSGLTWVIWEVPWQPRPGNSILSVRAIDMEGNVQDPTEAPPAPDGSSGYHSISVIVS
jgi:DMSO/TMAO reductase YedYZ molybdopterin-dependent catalytic subunit